MINVTPATTAIEPVAMFRSSCQCGWWRIEPTEDAALVRLTSHTVDTRCDCCTRSIDHDRATIHDQQTWAGAFCRRCAPSFAPV
jgi:hypothetical protein